MSGTLTICATPIGNLEDITARVLRILKEADIIAAEDTRHTIKLLNYFEISTPMTSYHEHNKLEKGPRLVEDLRNGKNIALVSDAGMPGISDPGQHLVKLCHENGIPVTCAPGATAGITALALSGFKCGRFIFEGFLPQNKKERTEILSAHVNEERTVIFYEAPHHLKKTLADMSAILGADRQTALVRELTKKYEQIQFGSLAQLTMYFDTDEPKGEYVIVLEGLDAAAVKQNNAEPWQTLTLDEHMALYTEKGFSPKQAMKAVAADRNVSKSTIYSELLGERNG